MAAQPLEQKKKQKQKQINNNQKLRGWVGWERILTAKSPSELGLWQDKLQSRAAGGTIGQKPAGTVSPAAAYSFSDTQTRVQGEVDRQLVGEKKRTSSTLHMMGG